MTSALWRVVAASVQGTSHQKQNLPCQDAHALRVLDDGTLLVAVADGAGSAARSQEGAQLATREALASLECARIETRTTTERAWNDALRAAFAHARNQVIVLAAHSDSHVRLFATTLTCAVVADDWLAVARIGDGAAIVELADGRWVSTVAPIKGEYANETFFLTMDDALARVEVQAMRENVRSLAVTTDGLIRLALKLPDYAPHIPFFQPLLKFAADVSDAPSANEQLAAFLASERVNARTDDDKTLVLAVRVPQALAQPTAPLEVSGA